MLKRISVQLLPYAGILIVLLLFAGSTLAQVKGFGLSETVKKPKRAAAQEKKAEEPGAGESIAAKIQSLSLRARIAQLMIVTLLGKNAPTSPDAEFLSNYAPGGVIIPATLRPASAADYVLAVRRLPIEAQKGIPLLIGANLYQLAQPGTAGYFAQLPSLLSIAAANDPDTTARAARLIAGYLTTMGFNMHLGPSLELAPVLPGAKGSLQSLGSNPEFAANAGGAILKSLSESGIVAVPMGFPGGGADRRPKEPALLLTPKPSLTGRDLLPYARAVEQGAAIIHVGNTRVPTIEPDMRPASLSAAVMRDLLRGQLGFQGVILVGPLDSSDVSSLVDPQQAAVQALQSGADMMLWNEAGPRVMKTIERITVAVNAGALSEDTVNAALTRVLAMKEKQGLLERPGPKVSAAEKIEKNKDYPEEAYHVERRAVTLVQNLNNTLPLRKESSMPIGVTGTLGVEQMRNALQKHLKPIAMQPILTAKHMGDIADFEIKRIMSTVAGVRTVVCVFSNMPKTQGQANLIRQLKGKGVRVVVALFGYPEALPALTEADAIVLAYSEGSVLSGSIRAVADVLAGAAPVGILPVVRDLTTQAGKKETYSVFDVVRCPTGVLPVTIREPFVAGYAIPYDPTHAVDKVEWEFGDGRRERGLRVEHAFAAPGRYPIQLTVRDRQGGVTRSTFYAAVE